MKPVNIPSRIHYFYENVLRHDLLLKLHCLNAMEVPRLNTVIVFTKNISPNNRKNISLALEIICGQKAGCSIFSTSGNPQFSSVRKQTHHSGRIVQKKKISNTTLTSNSQIQLASIMCSLRSHLMYNFLEKCLSFLIDSKVVSNSSNHFTIQVHGSEIQLNLHNREFHLFPEIQNHFEVFETFQKAQIRIITSAKNENDTKLLWAGLEQKEI